MLRTVETESETETETWKPKETDTYLYGYCVYDQLQNKNHRCQCKQMHGNYFRITTALCHLTAVLFIDWLIVLTN